MDECPFYSERLKMYSTYYIFFEELPKNSIALRKLLFGEERIFSRSYLNFATLEISEKIYLDLQNFSDEQLREIPELDSKEIDDFLGKTSKSGKMYKITYYNNERTGALEKAMCDSDIFEKIPHLKVLGDKDEIS